MEKDRSAWLWEIFGFGVVSLLGTLLHFLYDLTGGALWIAPFSGVNESTWEHMKLLFWPMLIFGVIQGFFFRERGDFLCVKLKGTLLGLVLIPLIFYTYNGVIGKSPDWVNIAIFFVAAAAAYFYEARQFSKEEKLCPRPVLAVVIFCVIAVMFILFSFYPPRLAVFQDPLTLTYGISD